MTPLRLLILEDNQSDALLVVHELRRALQVQEAGVEATEPFHGPDHTAE